MKKLSRQQAQALYFIEKDGGLMRTFHQEHPYTTATGRPIHAVTAQWLYEHGHLIANEDGLFHNTQSWRVAKPIGVNDAGTSNK